MIELQRKVVRQLRGFRGIRNDGVALRARIAHQICKVRELLV